MKLAAMVHSVDDDNWFMQPVFDRFSSDVNYSIAEITTEKNDWDFEAMCRHYSQQGGLVRVKEKLFGHSMDQPGTIEDGVIQAGPDEFIWIVDGEVRVITADRQRSRDMAVDLMNRFGAGQQRKDKVWYCLVNQANHFLKTVPVEVNGPFVREESDLEIFYGKNFPAFDKEFKEKLRGRNQGIAIFRGEPGTGKTSYLRHLMWALRDTHLFYAIPLNSFHILTSTEATAFWIEERFRNKDKKLVLVLEDAENLILGDGNQRNEEIATLLNYSDGLLGDFLQTQMIVTANCELSEIDPAVIRPGRLIAFREFPPLSEESAKDLATKIGLTLPVKDCDWTLAEVFRTRDSMRKGIPEKKKMGFARP